MLSSYLIQPAGAIRGHINFVPEAGGIYVLLLDHPKALDCAASCGVET
ncbi:hypothetical protein MBEBAB_0867 [Brevundimonas abyssalis TAR-001]|uniref:Uncharacterized protein n=1 Tax=Brevundimonas abyssalis TAR-001 TaxID=1391729 RepID=A0A8E0NB68_9CAUL|nr:hypothetical protein MBEBAB_0867 [Brevundimonas abyssalis TAR-001]